MEKFKIFIGYDSRQDTAYEVCKYSLELNSSIELDIIPIKQKNLREQKIYYREVDILASTEFSITRFLVPFLCDFKGPALFCDCDFLFTIDIKNLIDLYDPKYAVQVVQHEYEPDNQIKMEHIVQTTYNRKNWSSLILYNCGHEANSKLTIDTVNQSDSLYLHQFKWLTDNEVGKLDHRWNHLVGVYDNTDFFALHFTNGGPWLENYKDCQYAKIWNSYKSRLDNKS